MKGLRKKPFVVATAVILSVLFLFAWTMSLRAAESKPRYGGTLTMSDVAEYAVLGYPPKMSAVPNLRQAAPAVETLLRFDKTGRLVPWLATGLKENTKTKTIIINLRKGVKFHDGTDFNADAVKWNIDQAVIEHAGGVEQLKSIEAVDDYTVRLNLTEWNSNFTNNLAMFLGLMVSPTACKKSGIEWCEQHPVGTGPFYLVSRQKDVRTTFKKFNGYWQKGKPFLDQIEIRPIVDTLTRELSLRKGELNAMVTFAGESLAAFERDGFVVTRRSSGSGGRFLVPDSANPNSPFRNVKVRQATQHAIDTQTIAKTIFYGEAEPANQLTYKGYWAYNPSVVGYPYNPAKARQLLAEGGYASGFKTKVTYYTNRENDLLYSAIQAYLKEVGIDLELNPTQMAGWNTVLTGAKWEGLYVGRGIGGTDPVLMLSKLYSGTGGAFVSMFVPEDYAKAVQKAVTAPNFKEKQKWTREAWKLMIDKYALVLPITCTTDFIVTHKSLRQSGLNETPYTAQWTPEDAWLAQ